jgi:hypothetical protein
MKLTSIKRIGKTALTLLSTARPAHLSKTCAVPLGGSAQHLPPLGTWVLKVRTKEEFAEIAPFLKEAYEFSIKHA